MNESSPKTHIVPGATAVGNREVKARPLITGLFFNSPLPPKLYESAAAGTPIHFPIRDPEIGKLRDRISVLEQQDKIRALEKQIDDLRAEVRAKKHVHTVALQSLGHATIRLRQALWVDIDASGEDVTAHVADLEEYGQGHTEYEALDHLRAVLVDTYSFLSENEAELGPGPARQLQRFRDLLEIL